MIRSRYYDQARLEGAPEGFQSASIEAVGLPDTRYTLQVYVEDCTGCELCVQACPVVAPGDAGRKAINLAPREPLVAAERKNIAFFETLPVSDRSRVDFGTVRGTQFLDPLFEFSGACTGCGETPYLKLLSQLFGDRLMVANATGCSSIYGGNLPTTPWTTDGDGRGPAWSNSLFEDNAEFGLGFRLAADRHTELARRRLTELREQIGPELVDEILAAPQLRESELRAQRERVAELRRRLDALDGPAVADLRSVVDHLVRRSVWIVGGDGWAYDIGSGGLDHVLASERNVNVLVLDTEVYSNTGGQMSKATPLGAVAKFAAAGKTVPKKDLALQAIAYGSVYVARVAMGADPQQTLTRVPRGGGLRRPLTGARLQSLHRTRHRDARRARPAIPRRGQRLLATDPLRPARACSRRQPVPARLAAATHLACRVHQPGVALPLADEYRPGRGRTATRAGGAGARSALGRVRGDGNPGRATLRRRRAQGTLMDLSTDYMGLVLRNPLVASASPLSRTVDGVRRLADAGVGAVVLYSLFEEQLRREAAQNARLVDAGTESFAESLSYFPAAAEDEAGPRRYLSLLERAAAAVDVPVIGSLNGVTPSGWADYARAMQDAGAAAIELNIYYLPGDPRISGRDVEQRHVDVLTRVKDAVSVPVAVKLSPYFSSTGEMALRLDEAGADALVLFNRFLQPDIDADTLAVVPHVGLSSPAEARLPRTWIALLHGRVRASLAATTGVETPADVAKYLLAGADVVMTASALLRHGPEHATVLLDGLSDWMARKGFAALDELRGTLAVPPGTDEALYERAGYVGALREANSGIYGPW